MKRIAQTLLCVLVAFTGYKTIASNSTIEVSMPHGTIAAATIPKEKTSGQYSFANIPEDILRDQAKKFEKKTDTIVKRDTVQVTNIKYVQVSSPENTTDTMYLPMVIPGHMEGISVNNKMKMGREEQPNDEHMLSSKEHVIHLAIDGEIVYSSENDNHSAVEE